MTHHNFPHRFRGNQSASIAASDHLLVTSLAKVISNNYAIIERDGVFKADLEESISILWDKLVSVLHQATTGSLLEEFVPVPELVTTLLQCIFGGDGDCNDA